MKSLSSNSVSHDAWFAGLARRILGRGEAAKRASGRQRRLAIEQLETRALLTSITAGTFNVHIAGVFSAGGWGIDDWIETRRDLVFDAVEANQPDFLGFQEAFARPDRFGNVTQQTSLGEVFDGTKWDFYTWEVESEYNPTPNENNWNPIIVNMDRFTHVAAGSKTVDFEAFLGEDDWHDYHHLHEIFHGEQDEHGEWSAHSLEPERYVNWVVADETQTGERAAFLTSHYETFIGDIGDFDPTAIDPEYGVTYQVLFDRFSDLVNDSLGYASEEIHAQAEALRDAYGDLGVIIGGDFETGDPTLPAQQAFEDAGYVETWRTLNGNGRRPTQGIDTMFVMTDDFTIDASYYDETDYTNADGTIRASDHRPLYAELTVAQPAVAVKISQSAGSTDVTEGGATDTYSVALASVPTANVVVTVTPDVQTDLGSGAGTPYYKDVYAE